MFSAFFGHYLLKKGLVSKEELSSVLDKQKKIRLTLGVLAVNSNIMTAEQVEEVHQLQISQDLRFGEIAISKGYISDEQLVDLLGQQKSEHLLLAQALIDDNIMTMASFEEEIKMYKIEHGLSDDQFDAIKSGNVDVVITAFIAFEKNEASEFYINFVKLFVKNLIRFVDTNVYIDRVERIKAINYPHLFKQTIVDDQGSTIYSAYSGDESAILNIASKHAEEEFSELTEYPLDSASEFLNLTNGLFVVNMSNLGREMTLDIQEYVHGASIHLDKTMYRIPIHLTSGTIYLIIGHI